MLSEVIDLYRQDKIIEANDLLQQIEASLGEPIADVAEIDALRQDMQYFSKAMTLLTDIDSFTLVREKDDIATYYKGSGDDFFLRAELKINAPIFHVLALFSEVDLYYTWVKYIKTYTLLAEPSEFRKLCHYRMDLPMPLSNREVVVNAQGISLPESNSAFILVRSFNDQYLGVQAPEEIKGVTRVQLHVGCANIKYISENETHLSLLGHSDPKLSWVPKAIINFITKKLLFYFVQTIRNEVAKFPGSIYEQRVEERAAYYNEIRERLSKYNIKN